MSLPVQLDNFFLGHRYIVQNFGASALPQLAWSIDPFGHSATMGVLSGPLSGFRGIMWGREASDFKALTCETADVERIWLPSASLGTAATTWQGIFVDTGYQSPSELSRCNYPKNDSSCNASNAMALAQADYAALVSDILTVRAPNVQPSARENATDVLVNLGSDFTYENAADYFAYIDALSTLLNDDKSGRFRAFYSTASDYAAAKQAQVASFRGVTGDFFPYNEDLIGHNMWSGYFTSRPAFKGLVRESSSLLQSARQLQALVGGVTDAGVGNPLHALERAMGVSQHHDSIAGTAREAVNADYIQMLSAARAQAAGSVAASLANATGYAAAPFATCPLANVSVCPALEAGQPAVVLVHNALGQAAPAVPVRVLAGFPPGVVSYSVVGPDGAPVEAQTVPLSPRDASLRALYGGSPGVVVAWVAWVAALPPAGTAAYFLLPAASAAGAPATHASIVTPIAAGSPASITNGRITLGFSASTGQLASYTDAGVAPAVTLPLTQAWAAYEGFNGTCALNGSKQASGAYIFRPVGSTPASLAPGAATLVLVTGPVLSEARSTLAYADMTARLWAGAADAEMEWTVGPVDVSAGQSREVVSIYAAGAALPTAGAWVSDSNCREGIPRVRGARAQWNASLSEPVAGNYYPTSCLIRASGGGLTLAIATDRAQGSSSLSDGALELMVHRRMLFDDGRGVGEALDEPGLDGRGLIVRGRHWLAVAPAPAAAHAYKALQQRALALPYALSAFAAFSGAPTDWLRAHPGSLSLLAAPLPPNVHLATVQRLGPRALLLRLAHLYEAGEDAVGSANATLALASLFNPAALTVLAAVEMTLPGAQPLADVPPATYTTRGGASVTVPILPAPPAGPQLEVTLSVQQIRTFLLTLA